MTTKILCVDDDPSILAGYQRNLRKHFDLDTALGAEASLNLLATQGPYAVVVADMKMPGMNGIQLLIEIRRRFPDTVRFMLTGNSDQPTAIAAVNQGHVFQFLTKPCPPEILECALSQGIEQYRLITAERELLQKTLHGSVKLLMDVLALADPPAFGMGQKLREQSRALARSLDQESTWEIELAAMLSQLGVITVPAVVMDKHRSGFTLAGPERDMIDRIPEVGAQLLANIPRLETVSRIIRYQAKHYDGSGFPVDTARAQDIPIGGRILKVLLDLAQLEAKGTPRFRALEQMRSRPGGYDPNVLSSAFVCFEFHRPDGQVAQKHKQAIALADLKVGHILAERLETRDGVVVAGQGTEVTQMVLQKLSNFASLSGIKEPLYVEI